MYEKAHKSRKISVSHSVRLVLTVLALVFFVWTGTGARTVSAAENGFQIKTENGKKVCYYYKNGKKLVNSYLNISGKKYYFDKKGHQIIGWQKGQTGGYIRYFMNKLGKEGYMATGFMKDSSGNIRYFNLKTGMITRGWLQLSDGWRYFDTKTGIAYKGVRKIGKYYYYFIGNNNYKKYGIRCQAGFKKLGSKTYYFNPKDGHGHIGWLTLKGKKYYFDPKGVMFHDCTKYIGGKKYTIDSNGVCTLYGAPTPTPSPTPSPTPTPAPEVPSTAVSDQPAGQSYDYTDMGSYVVVYDQIRKRNWNLVTEFKTDRGVANGKSSDRDILAALVDAEAGGTGLTGMTAVAMTVLNRTIDKYFPSEIRYVVYQECNSSHVPGHSVVRWPIGDAWLNKRLNGNGWTNKALAYKAVDEALRIFRAHVNQGTDRVIPGFYDGKDMNFKYFMTPASFAAAGLHCFSYTWGGMTFFVDWPLY